MYICVEDMKSEEKGDGIDLVQKHRKQKTRKKTVVRKNCIFASRVKQTQRKNKIKTNRSEMDIFQIRGNKIQSFRKRIKCRKKAILNWKLMEE